MDPSSEYRLPRTAVPVRYDLTLAPDLDAATFTGEEAVTLEVREATREIVLNAIELELHDATLVHADDPSRRLTATVALDEKTERATLALSGVAEPGTWILHVAFTGTLNDQLRGFYRSTFTDDDGATRTIAATQFEATDARRAFPCWDEPDLKAVFAVTLVVDEALLALSNGAVTSEEPTGDGRRRVRFADSMVMSTYLVAFVVGPLELTPPVDVDGVPLRVAHVPGKGHLTDFSLEVGAFCLRFFSEYYGIPYPGGKVDLVALPDFASGAMENLGCITFREVLLLVDPATATQAELQRVADVVAHELAHMWFGDLVTMRWWEGIWLNEAFATFMEVLAVDAYRPDWQRWTAFSLERSAAFDVDALTTTRPVEYPVHSPDEADGMFDVLTYQKGGAVLRMLEQYLGPERFRDGIRRYLTEHAYGNTETTDLWDAIEAATGEPVRRIMDSWIYQGGYPLLTVRRDGSRLAVRQQRFVVAGGGDGGERWSVPLLLRVHDRAGSDGGALVRRELLEGDRDVDLGGTPEVVVANAGAHGFFRVRYDGELMRALSTSAARELSPIERHALVDDTWAAVVAGLAPVEELLALARSLADETELAVWQALAGALGGLDRIAEGEDRARLQAFVRALVGPALKRLGWTPEPDEHDLVREVRGVLVRALALLGADRDAQARARQLLAAVQAGEAVDPPLAAAAVDVVAGTADAAEYEVLLERFRAAATPQEQIRFLYALADVPDAGLVARTLDLAMSEVRTQNAPFLLGRAMRNRDHGGDAWRFVRQRWAEVNERFPTSTIVRMLDGIRTLTDPAVAADVQSFFAEHDVPQGARTLQQLLERQRVNVALRQRESAALGDALRALDLTP